MCIYMIQGQVILLQNNGEWNMKGVKGNQVRQQTKLLRNNGEESLKGVKGTVRSWHGAAWCGTVWCEAWRGEVRHGRERRRNGKDLRRHVRATCVVVSGGEGVRWRHVLAAGLLGALSKMAVVAWRGCGLMWT